MEFQKIQINSAWRSVSLLLFSLVLPLALSVSPGQVDAADLLDHRQTPFLKQNQVIGIEVGAHRIANGINPDSGDSEGTDDTQAASFSGSAPIPVEWFHGVLLPEFHGTSINIDATESPATSVDAGLTYYPRVPEGAPEFFLKARRIVAKTNEFTSTDSVIGGMFYWNARERFILPPTHMIEIRSGLDLRYNGVGKPRYEPQVGIKWSSVFGAFLEIWHPDSFKTGVVVDRFAFDIFSLTDQTSKAGPRDTLTPLMTVRKSGVTLSVTVPGGFRIRSSAGVMKSLEPGTGAEGYVAPEIPPQTPFASVSVAAPTTFFY